MIYDVIPDARHNIVRIFPKKVGLIAEVLLSNTWNKCNGNKFLLLGLKELMIMQKLFFILFFSVALFQASAQSVEVQYDYNAMGDCIFGAYNNTKAPLFLHLNFADLENTTFGEPLPYVKRLSPGFTNLFTLLRDPDGGVPRFNYEIKVYRSDPMAKINLKFPYLIPFEQGRQVRVFDVEEIDGFWGSEGLDSWSASGFYANPGDKVFASRNGVVVEITGAQRTGEPSSWYNTWNNVITLLQPDGSLICYRNVVDKDNSLSIGDEVFAGQQIGQVAKGADNLKLLIYHESMFTDEPLFLIPEFVINETQQGILSSTTTYTIIHPDEIRGLEMSKKEQRKILGKKK